MDATRTPFRCVEQGHGKKFDMRKTVGLNTISKAVGVIGVAQCVGMYVQLDKTHCFCAHINMAPMRQATDPDNPEHAEYKKIKFRTVEFLNAVAGTCDIAFSNTLVIVNSYPLFGSRAMIHGILKWAGIEEKTLWVQQNIDLANGFVVPAPGNPVKRPVMLYITNDYDDKGWVPVMVHGMPAMEPISPVLQIREVLAKKKEQNEKEKENWKKNCKIL